MARDMKYRQYTPIRTVGHWHYVRRSEKSYILPYIGDVEYILNGALSYELPYMKAHLIQYFPEIVQTYREDLQRQDAYMRAERAFRLLSSFDDVEGEFLIPGDSVLREFIDYFPWIAADESYLLFASSRPSAGEVMHLHVSFRQTDGSWSKPVNIHPVLGFEEPARSPTVSPDGRFLFFLSGGQVYWVDIAGVLGLRDSVGQGDDQPPVEEEGARGP